MCPVLGAGSVCSSQGAWCWDLAENGRLEVSAVSHVTPTDLHLVQHLLAARVAPAVIKGQRTVLLFLFMLPGFVFTAVVVEVHEPSLL